MIQEAPVGEFYEFPVEAHDLLEAVADALNVTPSDLGQLHKLAEKRYDRFTRENDQSTEFHREFYANFADYVEPVFKEFVAGVIRPLYSEAIAYQRIPTFRVHLPLNLAVGEFHRDRDYAHSPAEENYWVPLTKCWGTNTIWIESEPGLEDYLPIAMDYGQILKFDGANLKHGNLLNEDDWTRVSMDFRVIPMSRYQESDRKTINTGMRFAIGGYFAHLA